MRHPILNTVPGTGEAALFYLDEQIDTLDRNLKVVKTKASAVRPTRRKASYPAEGPAHPWK